ncbi:NUDIX domain-containing protein [Nocardioides sp. dk4132]|nr:NUDIX domain-containing protein [Nocardioides sp. dk4132]QGA09205.1 NUDIX domain-containing protein [Nocardioides sp. dk884]
MSNARAVEAHSPDTPFRDNAHVSTDRPTEPTAQPTTQRTTQPSEAPYDTRLAAYAVVLDEDDRVLLALWNEPAQKRWTLPGGGVDLHETPEEGVVREVREETGYDVELLGLLGVDTGVIPASRRLKGEGRPLKAVRVLYAARVIGGELTAELDGSTDEARWHPLSEVEALPRVGTVDVALELQRRSTARP